MGRPITGAWQERTGLIPYANASKWGTGANPVHAYYGTANLRVTGREGEGGGQPDLTPPSEADLGIMEQLSPPEQWGYDPEDFSGLDAVANEQFAVFGVPFTQDDWPSVGDGIQQRRGHVGVNEAAPWGSSRQRRTWLREQNNAAGNPDQRNSSFRGPSTYGTPTETVSEGWLNKAASGMHEGNAADSRAADDSQVFVQTSMMQRYRTQNNKRAQLRDTDADRTQIDSRVAPMKLKVYSGQDRHYDMTPRHADVIIRPFAFRQAATGRPWEMQPNDMYVTEPIQRTPAPDPSMGPSDTALTDGYTSEDMGWY